MVYKFFDKKPKGTGVNIEVKPSEQLAEELRKPIIRNFRKRTVYSGFKDNIWGADLADMQLISKFNKGFRFLLCVIDIFSKYAWVVSLKDKKGVTIANAFQRVLDKSGCKPNKTWLKDNDIEMYPIKNEGKSVVDERFIRTLKTQIHKYMTSVSKTCILINQMIW